MAPATFPVHHNTVDKDRRSHRSYMAPMHKQNEQSLAVVVLHQDMKRSSGLSPSGDIDRAEFKPR